MSNLSNLYDSLQGKDAAEKLLIISKLKDWIYKLDLFSSNESLEEISTKNLIFLSLPVVEATALSELNFENIPQRISDLEASSLVIQEYLEKIKFLTNDSITTCAGLGLGLDAAKSRDERVKEYKKEKELKEIVGRLEKRNDEEGVREFLLKDLELKVLKARKLLKSNNLEIELLKTKEDTQPQDPTNIKTPDCILDKQGKILRPFIITSNRKSVQQGVFRNSHNLPTMSIDEYLAREFERGNFLSQKDKGTKVEEDEELILEKERAWDDFKDDNPKGWGNRLNKS